jgi:hypothetical protein
MYGAASRRICHRGPKLSDVSRVQCCRFLKPAKEAANERSESLSRCITTRPNVTASVAATPLSHGRDKAGAVGCCALEDAGVEFIDENGGGPGVRLEMLHKVTSASSCVRKAASSAFRGRGPCGGRFGLRHASAAGRLGAAG